ncbi:hypothetical protein AVV36_gp135 [Pectobacterium bacteriophage PM2]|uniref:Uncharacterized protein n=1 Tax=Pectobacterium bacteriophage PM2 TaxID=1429794 RepID=A0A0A0Q3G8_9CAUD|nr:hypothetical protein AVV36_gp135 [Pectobacterium bacteriophage PM2]AHY25097.1 hypothetical protein PM2_135 [Pectobacterium bacteriophage PM2]
MDDDYDKNTVIATIGMILWPIISIFLAVMDAPPVVCFTSIIFGWFIYPFLFLISYGVTELLLSLFDEAKDLKERKRIEFDNFIKSCRK